MEQPLILFVVELWLATQSNGTFSSNNTEHNTYSCANISERNKITQTHRQCTEFAIDKQPHSCPKQCPCLILFFPPVLQYTERQVHQHCCHWCTVRRTSKTYEQDRQKQRQLQKKAHTKHLEQYTLDNVKFKHNL